MADGTVQIDVRANIAPAQAQLNALKSQMAALGGRGAAGAAAGGVGAAATAATITAQQRVANFTKSMGVAATAAGRWGRTMTWRATLPLTLLGTAAVKAANTFEQSFARINAIAGKIGMSTEDAQAKVKALASQYGQSPQELADALYFVASAGVKASQVMSVVEQSAKGAATGLADSATIAQMLTTVMNNYGQSGFTAQQGLNVLTEAIKLGKAEPEELADSLANVIPMASQLGVSFASMAGAVAQGTNAGLSAARAATGLRFILGSLQRPTNMAKDVLKEYGITVEDVQTKFKELGATGGIQYLANLFDTTTTKGKEAFAVLMGGQRGLIIANALIGENYRNAQRIDALMKRSPNSNAAEDAFGKATATNAFKFKKAMADLQVAMIDLGNVVVPIIVKDILPIVQRLVEGFNELSPDTKKMLVWAGIFTAIAGPAGQLLSLVLRLGQGLGILAGLAMRGMGVGAGAAAAAAASGGVAAVGPATVGSLGWAMPSAVAAGGGAAAAGTAGVSVATILTPLIITAVVALVAAHFENKRDNQRTGELTNPQIGGPTTGLLDPSVPRPSRIYSGVGGSLNPALTDDQKFIDARLSFSKSLRFADDKLQRWAQMVSLQYTMSDEQANTMVGLIRSIEGATGAFDQGKRDVLLGYLKQGDVVQALKYLADVLAIATQGVKNFSSAMLQSSGRSTASGIGGQRVNPEGLAGEHGLIGLAGGGYLVTRPTFIRNNVLTGEKRKKEAVIPLEDVRGRRVLAGAMAEAMGSSSGSTVVVNVAGKVERPEDIRRELDWWMRSRGL